MEQTSNTVASNHRGSDDAILVSCAAMVALAVMVASGAFGNKLFATEVSPMGMAPASSAILVEAVTPVHAPEPTIEQALNAIDQDLGASAVVSK